MPLGSPSISDVKNLDVRSIATAISNIRQRIEQIERSLGTTSGAAQSSTGATSLSNVLNRLAALQTAINNLADLTTQIEALPFSSGVDPEAEVPAVMGGVGVRVTAGDIARLAGGFIDLGALIAALSFSSGVDEGWFVPVEIGGIATRVTVGDIVRLAGTADLGTMISAAPFSSSVDPGWFVPVETGGFALRVTASDLAALAFSTLSRFSVVVTDTSTNRDLLNSDAGFYLRFTSASAKTVTFQDDATEPLDADIEFNIRCVGAGTLTLVPSGVVVLNAPSGGTLDLTDGMTVTVKRVATDVFDVIGQTVPV